MSASRSRTGANGGDLWQCISGSTSGRPASSAWSCVTVALEGRRSGNPEQVERTISVLDDARRRLYSILAEG